MTANIDWKKKEKESPRGLLPPFLANAYASVIFCQYPAGLGLSGHGFFFFFFESIRLISLRLCGGSGHGCGGYDVTYREFINMFHLFWLMCGLR